MAPLSNRISFTDEQGDAARHRHRLLPREDIDRHRAPADRTRSPGFDQELWNEMAGLGTGQIALPEDCGGSNLALAEVVAIVEPMGRNLAATPFVSTQLFAQALLAGGSDQMKRELLQKICSGSIGTVALFENDGDWDLTHIETSAVREGETLRLSGARRAGLRRGGGGFRAGFGQPVGAPALVVLSKQTFHASAGHASDHRRDTPRLQHIDLRGLKRSCGFAHLGRSTRARRESHSRYCAAACGRRGRRRNCRRARRDG